MYEGNNNMVSFIKVEGLSVSYIVDFRSARKLHYDHRSVAQRHRFAPNILGRACFFRIAPSLERARNWQIRCLCQRWRTPLSGAQTALTSLRRQIRCCALAAIITWVYELIDRQPAAETVTQAQRRLVRRKLVNTTARS